MPEVRVDELSGPAGLGPSPRHGASRGELAWAGRDLRTWAALSAAGSVAVALAVAVDVTFGTASAPFIGSYRWKLELGSAGAPLVALVVVVATSQGVHHRVPWHRLLALSWVAAVAWTAALASVDGGFGFSRPFESGGEYLADVERFAAAPGTFLATFDQQSTVLTTAARSHPPGPVVLLWLLTRFGIARSASLGVVVMLLGCLAVPLVATTVRGLAGERAARLLLPLLVLAPWAVWVAVSMEAVVATLGAAHLALAVFAAERRGRAATGLAVASGLLLGCAALFSYSVAWLGLAGVLVFFVRRRPVLVLLAGIAALAPLLVLDPLGFSWFDGLSAAQADFSMRVQPVRPWEPWVPASVLVLLLAVGPGLITSARRLRQTAAWPLLVGAAAAIVFALLAGLARGEVERTWLPFFPWLLVAAPAAVPAGRSGDLGVAVLAAVGAATAVALQTLLRTAW